MEDSGDARNRVPITIPWAPRMRAEAAVVGLVMPPAAIMGVCLRLEEEEEEEEEEEDEMVVAATTSGSKVIRLAERTRP